MLRAGTGFPCRPLTAWRSRHDFRCGRTKRRRDTCRCIPQHTVARLVCVACCARAILVLVLHNLPLCPLASRGSGYSREIRARNASLELVLLGRECGALCAWRGLAAMPSAACTLAGALFATVTRESTTASFMEKRTLATWELECLTGNYLLLDPLVWICRESPHLTSRPVHLRCFSVFGHAYPP